MVADKVVVSEKILCITSIELVPKAVKFRGSCLPEDGPRSLNAQLRDARLSGLLHTSKGDSRDIQPVPLIPFIPCRE